MELACLAVNMMQLPGSIHAYLKSINNYSRRMNLFGQIQRILFGQWCQAPYKELVLIFAKIFVTKTII